MLKVNTEPPENCEVSMTVEVDDQQADKLLKAAAKRIARQIQIRGFRPGKAPYNVVLRLVGEDAIREEAVQDLSQAVFADALKEADLEPAAPASMEDISWSPLVMKVRVPVDPIIDLGDYRSLRLEHEPVEVTDAEVDEALTHLQEEYASWDEVERGAELGDRLTMDVKEEVDGEVINDSQDVEFLLTLPDDEESEGDEDVEDDRPDLVTPLLGVEAGEERDFIVKYPKDFSHEQYAGKEVALSVTVHKVEKKTVYPLDDDLAQMVGDYDTLEQLRAKLAEDLRVQKQQQADNELADQAIEKIIENANRLEWHVSLEDSAIDRTMQDQDSRLQQNGLSLDAYLDTQKKTRDEWREELRDDVREQLKHTLVVDELAKLEELSLESQELLERINALSSMAGEHSDEMRQMLMSGGNVNRMANDLMVGKVRARLAQIVKGEAETETDSAEAEDSSDSPAETEPEETEREAETEPTAE